MASPPVTSNQNDDGFNNSSNGREEGELSSSDDDYMDSSPRVQGEGIQVASSSQHTQHAVTGEPTPSCKLTGFAGVTLRSSSQLNHLKNSEKNRVPFVISFSDDDSGNDSEGFKQAKEVDLKSNAVGFDGNKQLSSSLVKSQVSQQNIVSDTRMIPGKKLLSRALALSVTKGNGNSSRSSTPLPVGLRTHHRNPTNLKKKVWRKSALNNGQKTPRNNSELHDLRQLIALRENELKLKAAERSKEEAPGSHNDYTAVNLRNDVAMNGNSSADYIHFEQNEPENKRHKVDQPHSRNLYSDGRTDILASTSLLVSEKLTLGNHVQQISDGHTNSSKENLTGTSQFRTVQQKKQAKRKGLSADLTNGIDVNINATLIDGVAKPVEPCGQEANRTYKNSPKIPTTSGIKYSNAVDSKNGPISVLNTLVAEAAKCRPNAVRNNVSHGVVSRQKIVNLNSNSGRCPCDLVPESAIEECDNPNLSNGLGNLNFSGASEMDLESLLELEEMQDKELEEAQEHRRECEVQERNALKAYRNAQRALAEANGRCSFLYHQRDLFSAHFRFHMMESSSLLWSRRQHNNTRASVNALANVDGVNLHREPASNHQVVTEFILQNQHEGDSNIRRFNGVLDGDFQNRQCDSKVRSSDGAYGDMSDQLEGRNLASQSFSEPDASTSEPQEGNGATYADCSRLNDFIVGSNETFAHDLEGCRSALDSYRNEETCDDSNTGINDGTNTKDVSEDSLLLEASLRSQLFARLGIINSMKKRRSGQSAEFTVEKVNRHRDVTGNRPFSVAEKDEHLNVGGRFPLEEFSWSQSSGTHRSERIITENDIDIKNLCNVQKFSPDYGYSSRADPPEGCSMESASFSCPILSTFCHLKVQAADSSVQSETRSLQPPTRVDDEDASSGPINVVEPTFNIVNSMEYSAINVHGMDIGSYSSNVAINPFWPLCMYELRGKCNNEQCTWQHIRDYSSGTESNSSNDAAHQIVSSIPSGKHLDVTSLLDCFNSQPLAPPSYLVCLDILRSDSRPGKYVLVNAGQRWHKCLSRSLVLSGFLPSDLHSDEASLHGPEACVEVNGGWNRQSSLFHGRKDLVGQLDFHVTDIEQAVEIALLNLNWEVDKHKGRVEALKVLAQALEECPSSATLWIVYLHAYYSNQKSIGKDDMFQFAVEHSKESYELWLMFINSRVKLEDRLVGYHTALASLCSHASASASNVLPTSQWILDLFLQMINSLCIAGQVEEAVKHVYRLFPSTTESIEPDIIVCLKIYDKCVLFFCCVYLVMYKRLPDSLVQQFESQKELSTVEWPSANLSVEEKKQATALMEMVVDSLSLYVSSESLESESTLKVAHVFALNHIRCIAVLEGSYCSKSLLDRYSKVYPSCLELVLMSARLKDTDSSEVSFEGFEAALGNWIDGLPGLQCVWNQYAEYALCKGKLEIAKEILEKWYQFVWQVKCSKSDISDIDSWVISSSRIDVLFGLLNLSLHKLLQNEHADAHLAIERALDMASPQDYKHCVREHAIYLLKDGLNLEENISPNRIFNVLRRYVFDLRAFPESEPLSRSFIQSIKRPRAKKLVESLLCPMSSDFSILNLVLEMYYGSSLLPKVGDNISDVVDFVEAIMEIVPANHQLAISLCKLIRRNHISAAVSTSVLFWASSVLISSLFQAVPVAPEYVWVEAAGILQALTDIRSVAESFHKRALSVYPFSLNLWKLYLGLYKNTKSESEVVEAARERGIKLD